MPHARKRNPDPPPPDKPAATPPPAGAAGVAPLLAALGAGGMAVVLFDARLLASAWNAEAQTLLGTDDRAVLGDRLRDLARRAQAVSSTTGERTPGALPLLEDALAGCATPSLIWLLDADDATRQALHASIAPLREAETGAVSGVVVALRDISAFWLAYQMKDEDIGVASHELQAPLASLMLASRLIQRRSTQPERIGDVARLGEEIILHARRMSRLIEEMHDVARHATGRFVIDPEPCDLAQVARDAADGVRHVWKRTILLAQSPETIPGVADAERIWQVITNLLTNACKYSPAPAPVELRMTLTPSDAGPPRLTCAVTDHGQGIAPEQAPQVFDRFYRARTSDPNAARQQRAGMGLGLYIARAIVEAHGGHIWVESTPGVGSTFTFALPLPTE